MVERSRGRDKLVGIGEVLEQVRPAMERLREGQTIIDVEGPGKRVMDGDPRYIGICW